MPTARVTVKGEIDFRWILGGRAVQDVWIDRERSDGQTKTDGTTIRFYDPKIDAWRITWINPPSNVQTMIARAKGDEIVLEGKTANGMPIRWVFSEINQTLFAGETSGSRTAPGDSWRNVLRIAFKQLHDDNETQSIKLSMPLRCSYTMLASGESALRASRNSYVAFGQLDSLVGEWNGNRMETRSHSLTDCDAPTLFRSSILLKICRRRRS